MSNWTALVLLATVTFGQTRAMAFDEKSSTAVLLGPFFGPQSRVSISGDFSSIAYTAGEKGSSTLYLNGKPIRTGEISGFSLSPTGKLAYVARKGNQSFANIDGKAFGPYEAIDTTRMTGPSSTDTGFFSSKDGKRNAFLAQKNGKWWPVIDGTESHMGYDTCQLSGFSQEEDRLGYVGLSDSSAIPVVEDIGGPAFRPQGGNDLRMFLSKNGQHYICIAERPDGNRMLVLDGRSQTQTFYKISGVMIAPDNIRVASLVALDSKHEAVFLDQEQLGGVFDKIVTGPVFSPDGKHVAFAGMTGNGYALVVDGRAKQLATGHEIVEIAFSPRGRLFYLDFSQEAPGPGGRAYRIVSAAEETKSEPYRQIYGVAFEPQTDDMLLYSGERFQNPNIGAVAQGSSGHLVFRGKDDPCEEASYPLFSPDGKHVIVAMRSQDGWSMFLDHQPIPGFHVMVPSCLANWWVTGGGCSAAALTKSTTFMFYATKMGQLYKVEWPF